MKQLVGQAAEYAQIVTEEYANIMASETGYYPSPGQWLADLLDEKEARKLFKTLRRMPPTFPDDDPDLLLDPSGPTRFEPSCASRPVDGRSKKVLTAPDDECAEPGRPPVDGPYTARDRPASRVSRAEGARSRSG